MREDNQLIVLTHLSQLVTLVLGFGSLLLPLIIWLTQKDKVYQMDEHGKNIVNFQLSLIVYCLICIPLMLLCGIGFVGFIILGVISLIFPVINAIRASRGEIARYPFSLNFIS
ncbi:DUF4870 domain-containing protein [Aestuariibaculum sediminum]|uniref:DUF4870 domain-containing protein n=1 Tax=Aestuariibaculum sediminum TaxID=2770637 RepID=A0A8J6UG32_9FLAO|nr:DUF4870 domain-containing protein [Aestuariibaculum sediminum]MBD0831871.1 DUF4870 domain-containing protein [Aestuariibaculum sediminum]